MRWELYKQILRGSTKGKKIHWKQSLWISDLLFTNTMQIQTFIDLKCVSMWWRWTESEGTQLDMFYSLEYKEYLVLRSTATSNVLTSSKAQIGQIDWPLSIWMCSRTWQGINPNERKELNLSLVRNLWEVHETQSSVEHSVVVR